MADNSGTNRRRGWTALRNRLVLFAIGIGLGLLARVVLPPSSSPDGATLFIGDIESPPAPSQGKASDPNPPVKDD